MSDVVNFVMLVGALAGSMAFGILAAYWVLRVGFALMRPQREKLIEGNTRVARV